MKISYTKYGDYYLPDLIVPDKKYNIGRFGMMHLKYIKQNRTGFYTSMKITGKLMDYIQEIDRSAQEMYDDIISKFRRSITSTCMLTCIYSAPQTISSYYTAEVNHDLYGCS